MTNNWGWKVAAVLSVVLLAVVIRAVAWDQTGGSSCEEIAAQQSGPNAQRRISAAENGIEIELFSEVPFPARAMPTLLQIGTSEFGLSRHGDDSNTLIFRIPKEEFDQLTSQDPIFIHHGFFLETVDLTEEVAGVAGIWTFGTLETELLDCLPADSA